MDNWRRQENKMEKIKVFNKWSVEGLKVDDLGIKDYISLKPVIVPKTEAKYAGNKFHKSRVFIVERLINKLMVSGHRSKKHKITSYHMTGKGVTSYNTVRDTFMVIEKKTGKNPIEVFVKAIENAAPREEVVSIEYGGARYPKAVECAPQRRVDLALRYMTQGSLQKSFNTKKTIISTLSDEIIAAYNQTAGSAAIAKKQELERQADASR